MSCQNWPVVLEGPGLPTCFLRHRAAAGGCTDQWCFGNLEQVPSAFLLKLRTTHKQRKGKNHQQILLTPSVSVAHICSRSNWNVSKSSSCLLHKVWVKMAKKKRQMTELTSSCLGTWLVKGKKDASAEKWQRGFCYWDFCYFNMSQPISNLKMEKKLWEMGQ